MTSTPLPPAGWYPDPSGAEQERWWGGTQWTASVRPLPAAVEPTAAPSPYGTAVPAPYRPGGQGQQLRAPEGTDARTPFIWVATLLPLVDLILSVLPFLDPNYLDSLTDLTSDATTPIFTGWDVLSVVGGLVVSALIIVFSWLDHRSLVQRGVPRPFHWAWSFFSLAGAPVYVIGRSVVARRRTGSGIAPMWVAIGIVVARIALGIVTAAVAFVAVMSTPGLFSG